MKQALSMLVDLERFCHAQESREYFQREFKKIGGKATKKTDLGERVENEALTTRL